MTIYNDICKHASVSECVYEIYIDNVILTNGIYADEYKKYIADEVITDNKYKKYR